MRESLRELEQAEEQPLLLIVEDDSELRFWLGRQLQKEYAVRYAADGREALEKVQKYLPDLILLDLSIPLLDGYEVCRQVKSDERSSHIPIVMLTGHSREEEKMKGLNCGASAYLTKPFLLKEIRIRLTNLLEEQKRLQEKLQKELAPFSALSVELDEHEKNFLLRLRTIIEQHISDEQFTIAALADQMYLSRSQLHRKVKALTACSPQELLRRMRLLYAFKLLLEGSGSISEIATQCGFSSPAYFSTAFKEQFGYPPGEVRKKNAGN